MGTGTASTVAGVHPTFEAGHGAGHERTHKPAILSEASASSTSGTGLQDDRRAASFVKISKDAVGWKR
ncbi:unnamed protein product [Boreogadus saida]